MRRLRQVQMSMALHNGQSPAEVSFGPSTDSQSPCGVRASGAQGASAGHAVGDERAYWLTPSRQCRSSSSRW